MKYLIIFLCLAIIAPQLHAEQNALPQSLTLESAINYAFQKNHRILLARQQVLEQDGRVIELRGKLFPTLSASANAQKFDEDLSDKDDFFPARVNDWQIAVEVRQGLYRAGASTAALRNRKQAREAARLKLQATINDTIFEVSTRFNEVLLERDRIQLEEKNIKLLEDELSDAKQRFKAGTISHFEVLRAEVYLANAMPALIRAENRHRLASARLAQSLGIGSIASGTNSFTQLPPIKGAIEYQPRDWDLLESLQAAIENRPDLQRLQHIQNAEEEDIQVARSRNFPTLDLVGGYALRKSQYSNRIHDSLDGWTAGIEGSWNIFDAGTTRGKVMSERAQYRQAKLQHSSYRLAVEVEVREAHSQWEEATQLVDAAKKVVKQAEEALRLARSRYDAGSATQLDVLQSQLSLTESRTNQLEAYHSHTIAVARLQHAIGSHSFQFSDEN